MGIRAAVLLLLVGVTSASACRSSADCGKDELCLRDGKCHSVMVRGVSPSSLPAECFAGQWPNLTTCVKWTTDEAKGLRICESNNVPPYHVYPYCPFGVGEGYCNAPPVGNSTDCPPFRGLVCPCVPGSGRGCPSGNPSTGDVMVPIYQRFEFPLRPDPTSDEKPLHMYEHTALKNGNSYQVIGAHLNGVQIKGPAEANGYNVDTSLIPLPCGGHVTPPVGPGPVYHYHKPADCLNISVAGEHGPLIGYASDGFGIYGFGDVNGASVLDECNGHFGPLPDGSVAYHYHAVDHYNIAGSPHVPYHMGCQGPSKGRCNTTVSSRYDFGANWCGQGCGYEVCVQPSTDRQALENYLASYPGGAKWLDGFTVNPY
eukprot:Sspe_Gene.104612::Locus_81227_Transcript_4_5_Confidence_0.583_Length_1223::g.104612::m.104612